MVNGQTIEFQTGLGSDSTVQLTSAQAREVQELVQAARGKGQGPSSIVFFGRDPKIRAAGAFILSKEAKGKFFAQESAAKFARIRSLEKLTGQRVEGIRGESLAEVRKTQEFVLGARAANIQEQLRDPSRAGVLLKPSEIKPQVTLGKLKGQIPEEAIKGFQAGRRKVITGGQVFELGREGITRRRELPLVDIGQEKFGRAFFKVSEKFGEVTGISKAIEGRPILGAKVKRAPAEQFVGELGTTLFFGPTFATTAQVEKELASATRVIFAGAAQRGEGQLVKTDVRFIAEKAGRVRRGGAVGITKVTPTEEEGISLVQTLGTGVTKRRALVPTLKGGKIRDLPEESFLGIEKGIIKQIEAPSLIGGEPLKVFQARGIGRVLTTNGRGLEPFETVAVGLNVKDVTVALGKQASGRGVSRSAGFIIERPPIDTGIGIIKIGKAGIEGRPISELGKQASQAQLKGIISAGVFPPPSIIPSKAPTGIVGVKAIRGVLDLRGIPSAVGGAGLTEEQLGFAAGRPTPFEDGISTFQDIGGPLQLPKIGTPLRGLDISNLGIVQPSTLGIGVRAREKVSQRERLILREEVREGERLATQERLGLEQVTGQRLIGAFRLISQPTFGAPTPFISPVIGDPLGFIPPLVPFREPVRKGKPRKVKRKRKGKKVKIRPSLTGLVFEVPGLPTITEIGGVDIGILPSQIRGIPIKKKTKKKAVKRKKKVKK